MIKGIAREDNTPILDFDELIEYVRELKKEKDIAIIDYNYWKQYCLEYKDRISKAIEYLNDLDTDANGEYYKKSTNMYVGVQKELLDILQESQWNKVEIAYLDDKPIGSDKE